MQDESRSREGEVDVPGGRLRYRLSGADDAAQTIVLENGWSGSFPYMSWLQRALAPAARVIAYDRAGIGYSRSDAPPTAAGMTRRFAALLGALGVSRPVTVVGHSYGGLIGMLHKAQAPELVQGVVQVDPTPEFADELIDASLRAVPTLARVLQLLALLRLDGLLMAELGAALPAEERARLRPSTTWVLRSLNGAIAEIRLLADIRGVIAASAAAQHCPRCVISAAPPRREPASWIGKRFDNPGKETRFRAAAHALHQRQAASNSASVWTTLPYSHVGLIADPASAASIAAQTLEFQRKMVDGI